jgi:ABC-type transport system involved in cytochrome c biogenesis permease subunit
VKVDQISNISLLLCGEIALCAITGFLFVATPYSPNWIEIVSGWDPDQHGGLVEWVVVVALLVGTLSLLNRSRSL